jgi:diguanylate cyclase (GGDEF)-like protein
MKLSQRMLYYSAEAGHPLNSSCADTIARVLLADGQTAQAAEIIEDALAGAASTDYDAVPACLITYAEIKRAQGDIAGAVAQLDRCRELTRRDGAAEMDAQALRLLATCHADLRDFEAAYREMVEFHDAWTVRRSEQNEVLTSITQARFALDEARRDSERFREMAEHDALTGLWNRRRSDEHLAERLARPDRPLSVAVLDLDHFKQVNDTYSHATGDAVLRRVGDILRTASAPVGHAARHGGEEFLLLLDLPGEAAAALCEQVRAAIEGHPWDEVVPGLHVTTSIGVTARTAGDDAPSVVARADAGLYAAKSGGRNRVTSVAR